MLLAELGEAGTPAPAQAPRHLEGPAWPLGSLAQHHVPGLGRGPPTKLSSCSGPRGAYTPGIIQKSGVQMAQALPSDQTVEGRCCWAPGPPPFPTGLSGGAEAAAAHGAFPTGKLAL